jgi:hypothetical protein
VSSSDAWPTILVATSIQPARHACHDIVMKMKFK